MQTTTAVSKGTPGVIESSPLGKDTKKPLPPPKPPRLLQTIISNKCYGSEVQLEEAANVVEEDSSAMKSPERPSLLNMSTNVPLEVYDDTTVPSAHKPQHQILGQEPSVGMGELMPESTQQLLVQLPGRFMHNLRRSHDSGSKQNRLQTNKANSSSINNAASLTTATTDGVSLARDLQIAVKWLKQELLQLKRQDKELYSQFLEVGAKINHLKQHPVHKQHHYTEHSMNFNPLKSLPDKHLLDASVISLPDFLTRHAGLDLSIHSPSTISLGNWSATEEDDEYDLDEGEEEELEEQDASDEESRFSLDEGRQDAKTPANRPSDSPQPVRYQSIRNSTPNLTGTRKNASNGHKLMYTFSETSL